MKTFKIIAFLFFIIAWQPTTAGNTPFITDIATEFYEKNEVILTINGYNLLNNKGETYISIGHDHKFTLDEKQSTETQLVIFSSLPDGDYRIFVSSNKNFSEDVTVSYDLTIGTVGPQGDTGSKGDTGTQGIQGSQGDIGSKGDTGDSAILGYKIIASPTVRAESGGGGERVTVIATCPTGKVVVGGGVHAVTSGGGFADIIVPISRPITTNGASMHNTWELHLQNQGDNNAFINAYAICVNQ